MKKVIFIYLVTLLPSVLFGQTEKQLVPSDLKQRTIVTEPATLNKGFFRTGMTFSYSVIDKIYNSERKKVYLPYNIWGSGSWYSLFLEYGFTDRLMVSFSLPYTNTLQVSRSRIVWPEYDTNVVYSTSVRGRGIGDCFLEILYQLVPEKENKTSLTGSFILTAPTGEKNPTNIKSFTQYDLPTGDGYFSSQVELRIKKIKYPYSYSGYMSYEYKFKGSRLINPTDEAETKFKDGNRINIGGIFSFHLNEWIALKNVLDLQYFGKDKVENMPSFPGDPKWLFNYQTILVFQVRKFRIGEGFSIPIKGKNVGADPGVVLLAQYQF